MQSKGHDQMNLGCIKTGWQIVLGNIILKIMGEMIGNIEKTHSYLLYLGGARKYMPRTHPMEKQTL